MPPIGLITDFGNEDYFIGAMKGAILSINPEANIVDITHEIPKHDIEMAAFILSNAAETFPKDSIFIAVIDPGVGTGRECILLRTENELNFIGPNNGVFTLIAKRFGIEEIREISNRNLMRSNISSTFHGRDIMAPVGAHLSLETNPSDVGPKIEGLKLLELNKAQLKKDEIHGKVVRIDDFGNIITNIEEGLIKELGETGDIYIIKIGNHEFKAPFVSAFKKVAKGEKLCYIGSAKMLEVAKNGENLAEEIDAKKNDESNIKLAR